jgi:hypothetical protein
VNIVADNARLIVYLEEHYVKVVGLAVDSAEHLRDLFEMKSNFGTMQAITGKPLVHNPCWMHSRLLVFGNAKQLGLLDRALGYPRPCMQYIRGPARYVTLGVILIGGVNKRLSLKVFDKPHWRTERDPSLR